jgi:hypothetical protein
MKSATITDKQKTISMTGDLITINSNADIEMTATGNITISAGGHLTLADADGRR